MIKKKLKIVVFHLAFFYSGGGEKLVLEEMKGLKQRGHQVSCFTPVIEESSCYPDILNQFEIKTIFPHLPRVPRQWFDSASLAILFACLFFPLVARKFKDFDVVLGAGQPGGWFGWWVKKLSGVPYVIYANQPTRVLYPRKIDQQTGIWMKQKSRLPAVLKRLKPLVSWADRISIKGGAVMLANGIYISRVLKRVYKRGNIVCPSGAYPVKQLIKNRWQGKVKANGLTITKPYVLMTNRHFPQKKFEYAINIWPKVMESAGPVNLVITGNKTEYTRKLEELVRELKLKDRIRFVGLIKEIDLKELYRQAAVYLYTSPEEDFGMGVIEAQAAGVPVVAWKSGGPATTIVNNKTGYLVTPYNVVQLTEKLIELIKNRQKNQQLGRAGRDHIKRHFTYKKHLDILEAALVKAAK